MHACGHDGHTAMLLAAAKHLAQAPQLRRHGVPGLPAGRRRRRRRARDDQGRPVREVPDGGDLRRAQLAGHGGRPVRAEDAGPCFASSNEFKITIRGKGAHGAMPHNGIDPVPVACQMVQAFQTIITRNKRPIDAGVISVTMIHAGEATNVVPDSCEIAGHGAHLHARGARPDRAAHEGSRRAHLRGLRRELRVRVRAQLPADHQPRPAETDVRRAASLAEVVGADNVHEFEPTMGAEDFSYFLLEKPGCYFLIGNGDGSHRDGGHGMGPCMLHNPSYDFNDELIPLGRDAVGAAGRGLAGAAGGGDDEQRRRQLCAELRRGPRQVPRRGRGAGLDVSSHPHPMLGRDGEVLAMDVVREGPRDAASLLLSAAPATASRAFAARACRWRCCATRPGMRCCASAGVAVLYVHALNPYGFSWLAPHDARERRPEPQLPRLLAAAAGQRRLRRARAPAGARALAADAPRCRQRMQRYIAAHGMRALQQTVIAAASTRTREGLFYGGVNPTWSNVTLRQVLREHGQRCRRLGWIDLHTGLGPSGHGERIFACRDDAAALARARAWWGAEVTSIYDGSSTSALLTGLMWLAAYEECAQAEYTGIALEYGTVPLMEVIDALRADQWLENHPEAGAAQRARDQAARARRVLHRHRRLEAAHRRAGASTRRGRPCAGCQADGLITASRRRAARPRTARRSRTARPASRACAPPRCWPACRR